MTSTPPVGPAGPDQTSRRLRADVALYATRDGHMLLAGDTHHHVDLDSGQVDVLLDALVDGHRPASDRAGAALDALAAMGLADVAPKQVTVTGAGVLATALRATLDRMGVSPGSPGSPGSTVHAADDASFPADLPATVRACWVSGHRVVLSPPAVAAEQVAARHRAATLHRGTDPDFARHAGGRAVRSSLSALTGPGLELAATQVCVELLRTASPRHEAVMIDLVALTVSRHPVLPVPAAPR